MIVTKVEYDELQERSDIVRDLCILLKTPVPGLVHTVQRLLVSNQAMYDRIHKIKIRPYPVPKLDQDASRE